MAFPSDPSAYKNFQVIAKRDEAWVYKAICTSPPDTLVAIKVVHNIGEVALRTHQLPDSHTVLKPHCCFVVGFDHWYVMPFMSRGDLHSVMCSKFPVGIPEKKLAPILKIVLEALFRFHYQGIVHGNVKSSNILLNYSVKLADSTGINPSLTTTCNNAKYWVGPKTLSEMGQDIWSFGVTALELAGGGPPLSGTSFSSWMIPRFPHGEPNEKAIISSKKFSKDFKEMVKACLNPYSTPSAFTLLDFAFFTNVVDDDIYNIVEEIPKWGDRLVDADVDCKPIVGWTFDAEQLHFVARFGDGSVANEGEEGGKIEEE